MTHVVHPFAHRLGIIRDWRSRWFVKQPKAYRTNVRATAKLRAFLDKRLRGLYVASVEIERDQKYMRVHIKTSRPGLLIGRGGEGTSKLTKEMQEVIRKEKLADMPQVRLDVEEVRSPEAHAAIVGYMVAEGLEKRQPFRRVLKQTIEKAMANRDVKGVRIEISGRLGGAEMSREEGIKRGRIPLQTFRADIDFAIVEALLPYGVIGIKTWIYRGEVFNTDQKGSDSGRGNRRTSAQKS